MTDLKQFGERIGDREYLPRDGAYGILFQDGRIACARVGYADFTYDLPGGGIDPGETPEMAVEREFIEEVGLKVRVTGKVTELLHYWIHDDGTPYNNHSRFFTVELVEDVAAQKVEPDHERVWLTPEQVMANLKNEGYGWAIILWLRQFRQDG